MKIKLIDGWKKALKFGSVQLALLFSAIAGLESMLPAMSTYLPDHWVPIAFLLIIAARVTLAVWGPNDDPDGGGIT